MSKGLPMSALPTLGCRSAALLTSGTSQQRRRVGSLTSGRQTLTPGPSQHAFYQSAFVGVSDRRAITAMAVATGAGEPVAGLAIDFAASPDGTQNIPAIITGATTTEGSIGNGAFSARADEALITVSFDRMFV